MHRFCIRYRIAVMLILHSPQDCYEDNSSCLYCIMKIHKVCSVKSKLVFLRSSKNTSSKREWWPRVNIFKRIFTTGEMLIQVILKRLCRVKKRLKRHQTALLKMLQYSVKGNVVRGIFMNASRILEAFIKCLVVHYQATLKAPWNILSGLFLKCLKGLQEAFSKNATPFNFTTHIHHSITHILLLITEISFQSLIA